jgi:N-acetylglucosaminyldiphosphoundecaprenol N-acetyl-beta-D-mannosaminyltransferase
MNQNPPSPAVVPERPPLAILGVPFDPLTTDETVALIARMISSGLPHYLATANVDFVVQASEDVELRRILFDAHAVLCDGMPLVWASRKLGNPLPERVTGSDLVPRLLREAEERGWRVYFLGGTDASVAAAAANTQKKHPKLKLVGAYSPPFKPLLEMDHEGILARIREAKPDLLFVAFGCPKQEKWINMHYRRMGVPVSIGVGATIDFLAGTVKRAPVWMQKTGLEWIFRMLQEPRRLAKRYGKDLWVFGMAIQRQVRDSRVRRAARKPETAMGAKATVIPVVSAGVAPGRPVPKIQRLEGPERLDAAAAGDLRNVWVSAVEGGDVVLDLGSTQFADSTGIGLLTRLRRQARESGREFRLAAVGSRIGDSLRLMQLESFFQVFGSVEEATASIEEQRRQQAPVAVAPETAEVQWQGDITAVTADSVASVALPLIEAKAAGSRLAVDLSGVAFVDSTGVGMMLKLKKAAKRRGVDLVYEKAAPAVLNVLKLTKLDEFLLGRRA